MTGLFSLGLLAGWSILALYAVHSRLPASTFELPFESKLRPLLVAAAPEGWAFFTLSPREPRVLPFAKGSDGVWRSAGMGPHSEARNLFGLNRVSRTQGVEMALLTGALSDGDWATCTEDDTLPECFERLAPLPSFANESPDPSLCGSIAIVHQEPLPWAWSANADPETMPSRIVRLEVTCS